MEEEPEYFGVMGMEDIQGEELMLEISVCTQEDIDALRQLLEACTGVSQCDSRVYDAVLEEGKKALTGELTVEEAVEEIEKKVSLYLAE